MGTQEERNKQIEHYFKRIIQNYQDYRIPKLSYLHKQHTPPNYYKETKRYNPKGYIENYVKGPILSVIDPHYQKRFLGSLGGSGDL